MPRQRLIKPGFFLNEELAECSMGARLFFVGLWCWADRLGRIEDRPRRLCAEILPYDKLSGDALMAELVSHGFIERYEVDGVKVIQILNFEKHQDVHPRETSSVLPGNPHSGKVNPRPTLGEPKANLDEPKAVEDRDQQGSSKAYTSYTSFPSSTSLKGSCSEVNSEREVVANLLTVGKGGSWFPVEKAWLDGLAKAYPGVDLIAETHRAVAWCEANPAKRKTTSGAKRFLVAWFDRAQNRGGTSPSVNGATKRTIAAMSDWSNVKEGMQDFDQPETWRPIPGTEAV